MRIVIPITLAEFSAERRRLNGEITKKNILHAAKQSELSKRGSNYPPSSLSDGLIRSTTSRSAAEYAVDGGARGKMNLRQLIEGRQTNLEKSA